MTGKEDTYRAAAIRALCSITDVCIVNIIITELKQFIVLFIFCLGVHVTNN